ncbi:unnamed protein product [Linum trigynum]|uniref:Uncharacterized protein n=1 Tax=Linum trigynum TaxID=586398 RepID=A0AAV2E7D7_9ROSI
MGLHQAAEFVAAAIEEKSVPLWAGRVAPVARTGPGGAGTAVSGSDNCLKEPESLLAWGCYYHPRRISDDVATPHCRCCSRGLCA